MKVTLFVWGTSVLRYASLHNLKFGVEGQVVPRSLSLWLVSGIPPPVRYGTRKLDLPVIISSSILAIKEKKKD